MTDFPYDANITRHVKTYDNTRSVKNSPSNSPQLKRRALWSPLLRRMIDSFPGIDQHQWDNRGYDQNLSYDQQQQWNNCGYNQHSNNDCRSYDQQQQNWNNRNDNSRYDRNYGDTRDRSRS